MQLVFRERIPHKTILRKAGTVHLKIDLPISVLGKKSHGSVRLEQSPVLGKPLNLTV